MAALFDNSSPSNSPSKSQRSKIFAAKENRIEKAIGFKLRSLRYFPQNLEELIKLTKEDEVPSDLLNRVFDDLVELNSTRFVFGNGRVRSSAVELVIRKICFYFIRSYNLSS